MATLPERATLILDEIQRVPRPLPEIHALIEKKRRVQYIMNGSSSRKLRRSVGDLLGGPKPNLKLTLVRRSPNLSPDEAKSLVAFKEEHPEAQ